MSKALVKNRNYTLDFIKFISAFFVVFIHIRFSGTAGEVIVDIARFAVPLFFIVSGFFAYNNNNAKLRIKAKNIFVLYVFSAVVYHIRDIIWLVKDEGVYEGVKLYLSKITDITNVVKAVFLNDVITSTQIWFLLALLYVYLLQMFFNKIKLTEKVIFVIGIVLLCVHIFLREGLSLFGMSIPSEFIRNFLLTGYPFFVIGLMMRKYQSRMIKIPTVAIVMLIIVGVLQSLISRKILGMNELYVGSVLIAISLVALSFKYPEVEIAKRLAKFAPTGTYIYVFHILVYNVTNMMLPKLLHVSTQSLWYINLMPVCVCVLSFAFSYLYLKAKSKLIKKNS